MNLLTGGGRRPRASAPEATNRLAAAVGALALGGSLLLAFLDGRSLGARLLAAEEQRDLLALRIAERERAGERLEADRAELAALRVAERRLARWDEERFLLPELLRGLSLGVTDRVVLEELRREGARLRLTARADSADSVAEAARTLSRLDRVRGLELLWVEQLEDSPTGTDQRFALAGGFRYNTREPDPFEVVGPVEDGGGPGS